MIHRIKSVFCTGLCCGLVMFSSMSYAASTLSLTKQTNGIEEVQNEISYFSKAGMGEENSSVDPAGSPRAAEHTYRISMNMDWDELLKGRMDPTRWFGGDGCYRGTENVTIILYNDMVVPMNSIRLISTNITFTLDLNGHSLMVAGGTLSVKSSGADGVERKGDNTFILKNGTMAATGIDTAGGMKKIEIQQVDFVNMSGNAVLCDESDEGSISGCTFSHAAGSNADTAIHVPDSGTIKISNVVVSGYNIGLQCGSNAQMEIADI